MTTYYIDYTASDDSANGTAKITPWKRCPGMVGFAGSYSHAAGDRFIFKGGVTWPAAVFPLTIGYSGTDGNSDYYGVDNTWYSGGSYSYPVFDGEDTGNFFDGFIIASGSRSYLTLDGVKVIRVGDITDGSGQALVFHGNSIEIKNCWIEPNCVNSFASACLGGVGKLYFHHNVVRKAGRFNIACGDNTYDDVRIYNNLFAGAYDYVPFTFHTDGLMIGADGEGGFKFTNLRIYNNKWYGDWSQGATAQIYLNGSPGHYGVQHIYIYNNVLATENTTGLSVGDGMIFSQYTHDDWHIYNNTIDARSSPGVSYGIQLAYYATNIDIRNNIITGVERAIGWDDTASGTITVDYNLFYTTYGTWLLYDGRIVEKYDTPAQMQAAGWGTNYCVEADPLFVALPAGGVEGSGNWHLQASSPAIGNAVVLNTEFTTDIDGKYRGAVWDIGACEYQSAQNIALILR